MVLLYADHVAVQLFSKFLQHYFKKRMCDIDQSDELAVDTRGPPLGYAGRDHAHAPSHADPIGQFLHLHFELSCKNLEKHCSYCIERRIMFH